MDSGGITLPFLTSSIDGSELLASYPYSFTLGERAPGTHWTGGWVGHRVGLDPLEKRKIVLLPGMEPQPPSL
jgi:hypothetical protein